MSYALALGFVLVCIVQLASLAVLLFNEQSQYRDWKDLQEKVFPALRAQDSMENQFLETRVSWRSYLISGDPVLREKFQMSYDRLTSQIGSAPRLMADVGPAVVASLEETRLAVEKYHGEVFWPALLLPVPLPPDEFSQISEASLNRASGVTRGFFNIKREIEAVHSRVAADMDRHSSVKLIGISSLVGVALVITGYVGWLSLRATRFFRQAEEERRVAVRQGQFFKAVLDQLPAGVSVRSAPGGETVLVNRMARQIMGQARIPQSVTQVTTEGVMHPDGKPYRTAELPMMRTLTRGEAVSNEEMLIEKVGGTKATVLCSSTPVLDESKQPAAAITILQDISIRKNLESRLREKTEELNSLVQEQRLQIRRLQQLQELSAIVSIQTSAHNICTEVLPAIAAMMHVEKCVVWLADPDARELRVASPAQGLSAEQLASIQSIQIQDNESPWMQVFSHDKAVVINSLENNPDVAPYRGMFLRMGSHTMAIVRLTAHGKPVGILAVFDRLDSGVFMERDVQLLRILAGPVAIAFDNAYLYDSLRNRSEQLATLLQEAHHRIKNNLATVTSLLSLEMSYGLEKTAAQICASTISRIESIARVHALLTRDATHAVPVKPLLEQLVQSVSNTCVTPQQKIKVEYDITAMHLPSREATALALVTSELVSNALRHGFADRCVGNVKVQLRADNSKRMALIVTNDGNPIVQKEQPPTHGLGLRIVDTVVRRDLQGEFTMGHQNGLTVATVLFQPPPPSEDQPTLLTVPGS